MRSLTLALILFLSTPLLAEYGGWYIEYQIKMKSGKEISAHVYRAAAYFNEDSIQNSHYLIRDLDFAYDQLLNDSITYFQKLIRYPIVYENDTFTDYAPINKASILASQIASISIINRISYSYVNSLEIMGDTKDLSWLRTPPIRRIRTGGYFCEYELFVHKESNKIQQILDLYHQYEREYEDKIEALEEIANNANGPAFYEAREKIENLEESRDEWLYNWIIKLKGEKVVVKSSCTC